MLPFIQLFLQIIRKKNCQIFFSKRLKIYFAFFFVDVISTCAKQAQVANYPQSWDFTLDQPGYICVNSSISRSVYSIGYFPDNSVLRTAQESQGEFTITGPMSINQDNTLFFALSSESWIEIYAESGKVSVAAIGIGLANCTDGISVTNQVRGDNLIDITLTMSIHKCIFFGSYASGNITFTPNLKETDKFQYISGNSEYIPLKKSGLANASISDAASPVITYIDTTNEENARSIKFSAFLDEDKAPKYPVMREEKMTLTPIPQPSPEGGNKAGMIAGIVIGSIIFVIIFVSLVIWMYKRRKYSLENYTLSSDSGRTRMKRRRTKPSLVEVQVDSPSESNQPQRY